MTVNITLNSAEAQKIVEDKYRDLFFYPDTVNVNVTINRTSLSIIDALTLVTAARWAYAEGGGKNLINAVKEVRTLTGCGAKEAKDFCDALFGAI